MLAVLIVIGNIVCIVSALGGAVTPLSVRSPETFAPQTGKGATASSWVSQYYVPEASHKYVLPVTRGRYKHIVTSSGHLLHQVKATVIASIMPMVMVLYSTHLSSHGGLNNNIKITPMNRTVDVYQHLQEILKSHALFGKLKALFRPLLVVFNHYHCY